MAGKAERALKGVALAVARWLRSVARVLAEWSGMKKRLEITVKNPGYEGTDHALGLITLDFEDENALALAVHEFQKLGWEKPPFAIFVRNEKDEMRGFNTSYYVSIHVADVKNSDDWERPNWLPEAGSPPPDRES